MCLRFLNSATWLDMGEILLSLVFFLSEQIIHVIVLLGIWKELFLIC